LNNNNKFVDYFKGIKNKELRDLNDKLYAGGGFIWSANYVKILKKMFLEKMFFKENPLNKG
jgi:hypothetical protein